MPKKNGEYLRKRLLISLELYDLMKEYIRTNVKKRNNISISNQARKNVELRSLYSMRIMLADSRISNVVSIRVMSCFNSG